MDTLDKVLRDNRKRLGLSRKDLATAIGRTASYIAALEDPNGSKTPSREVLLRLADALSCPDRKTALSLALPGGFSADICDSEIRLEVILAALEASREELVGIVPWRARKELTQQSELRAGANVWIITNFIAEARFEDAARQTADNIVNNGISYSYFVPFSTPSRLWQDAVNSIGSWIALRHQTLLRERIRVYRLADCAFGSRMRISLPPGAPPVARYSISAAPGTKDSGEGPPFFYPVPQDLADGIVQTLRTLIDRCDDSQDIGKACPNELGLLRQVFPAEDNPSEGHGSP